MVLKKCTQCNLSITKKSPGLECSRCEKVVHAASECAKLSTKQLAALRAADGLEWCCNECSNNISRRSSFFVPEDDVEEPLKTSSPSVDLTKLMKNLTAEIKKIIKEELEQFQHSLEFIGDQVASIEEILKNQNNKIKQLENKNCELINGKKNLELRLSALEQRLDETEQKHLCTLVEIAGLPNIPRTDINKVTSAVAAKLEINDGDIHDARQVTGRTEKSGYLLVELKSKVARDRWIAAAKTHDLKVGDISSSIASENKNGRIYVREALTRSMKSLLYQAKQRLKTPNGPYKYVWCKAGKIYIKKSDDSKNLDIIRSNNDIDTLLKSQETTFNNTG